MMKLKHAVALLLLFNGFSGSAQLTITAGGQLSVFSDTRLTLKNTDLVNNGDLLLATTAPVTFTGDASSSIGGDQVVRFFNLEINKTANQSVVLQKTISVGSGVFFTSGFFDLNGFNVDLETTGSISGENNNSRFIGVNGGQVVLNTTLDHPTNLDPGNLGMVITSNENLGQVTIKRGHQSQTGEGLISSILRYFEVSPVNNNTSPKATLHINYFDGELNSINENLLSFFKTTNSINWSDIGSSLKDKTANFVEITNVDLFSKYTLSASNSPLPVRFILFNTDCSENRLVINWKTAQEQNTAYYNTERSDDGVNWTVLAKVSAARSSSGDNSYQYIDNTPSVGAYYRVAEFDVDGAVHYTNMLRSSCSTSESFSISPNPVHDKLFVNLASETQAHGSLNLFDSRGMLVRSDQVNLLKGNNQFSINMSLLAKGVYYLSIQLNDRQPAKSLQIIRQ